MITDTIKTEIWEDVPGKPGYVRHIGQKPKIEVFKQVETCLREKDLLKKMDYFSLQTKTYDVAATKEEFPWSRWIAVYPVIGDNEGHYIHVDAICVSNFRTNKFLKEREALFLGKTFEGFEVAAQIASEISALFNK